MVYSNIEEKKKQKRPWEADKTTAWNQPKIYQHVCRNGNKVSLPDHSIKTWALLVSGDTMVKGTGRQTVPGRLFSIW